MTTAMRLPFGYAGLSTGRSCTPSMMNSNFTKIYQAYTNRDNIDGDWVRCASTCYADVRGFGFGVSCNTSGVPYDLNPFINPGDSATLTGPVNVYSASAWQILSYDYVGPAEDTRYDYRTALLLSTTFMETRAEDMKGSLTSYQCAFRGGIVSYAVTISSNITALQSPSWRNDTFLEDWGLQELTASQPTNIAGFILAANNLYAASASYQFGGAVS